MNFLLKIGCFILRRLLALRYHVVIEGRDNLNEDQLNKKGGVLFLPNHPAHIDPLLVILYLWPKFQVRPLVVEYIYRYPYLQALLKLVHALPIPNFETSINEIKLKKGEESLETITKGLKRKENFLLYPSGRLKHTGKEIIGGASAAHSVIEKSPNCNVVLIRTTGLWGSSFSRAFTNHSPDVKTTVFHGVKVLFKNFLFFTPRRKVHIQIEVNPIDLPIEKSRIEFNRYLENWYNRYPLPKGKSIDIEPLSLVSYSLLRKVYPKHEGARSKKKEGGKTPISPKKKKEIFQEISTLARVHPKELKEEMNLALDLGLDSLDIAQIVSFITSKYDVREVHPVDLETVQDILEMTSEHKKTMHQEEVTGDGWPKEKNRPSPEPPCGKNIPDAFLRMCEKMGGNYACADNLVGPMTYKKFKLAALALSQVIKRMPGENIAILLPASSAAYITILACMFAGKVPVMLNWTIGPKFLHHTMTLTKTQVVISSWRFLDRLSYVEFGDLIDKIRLLEDIRKKINFVRKFRAFRLSLKSRRSLMKKLKLNKMQEDDPAVILFTSGTESHPKGVPLSHRNLISNQVAGMQCIQITKNDVLFGILPPFHSFGFSVAGLLPLLTGVKVAFSPDPTDGFAIARDAAKWEITIFCGAPSFIKGFLAASEKKDLNRIRLFVSGAEKLPTDLMKEIKKLGKNSQLIEGYGITECSPMISLNRLKAPKIGVGQPLPGVDLCTIHPETLKLLPEHEEGEVCVRGPSVFHGYLGKQKSPFIEINKKSWYRTGDLGYLDKNNNLILSGRLKRFVKMGGEMVSLGAVEEAFKKGQGKPSIAIIPNEKGARTTLTLFTSSEITVQKANALLKTAGFSRLVKIAAVKHLSALPLTGTGKIDYRKLESML